MFDTIKMPKRHVKLIESWDAINLEAAINMWMDVLAGDVITVKVSVFANKLVATILWSDPYVPQQPGTWTYEVPQSTNDGVSGAGKLDPFHPAVEVIGKADMCLTNIQEKAIKGSPIWNLGLAAKGHLLVALEQLT